MNNNGYTYLYLNGVQETYISAPQIQTGGLHEITGTYDQKTANAIIYIDGMPQVSTAISPAVWITNSTTNFMTFASTPNGYLGATIIRGRVWNRALTTNEVAQLYISSGGNQYNGSFIGNGAGLTNYYYPSNSWPANLAALTNGMTTGGYKFANSNGWPVLLWYSNAVLQIELKP